MLEPRPAEGGGGQSVGVAGSSGLRGSLHQAGGFQKPGCQSLGAGGAGWLVKGGLVLESYGRGSLQHLPER